MTSYKKMNQNITVRNLFCYNTADLVVLNIFIFHWLLLLYRKHELGKSESLGLIEYLDHLP